LWDIVTCRLQVHRYLSGSCFSSFRFKQFFPDKANFELHLRSPGLYLLPHTVKVYKHVIFRKVVLFLHPVDIPNSVSNKLLILYVVTYNCVLQLIRIYSL
jgi:hypothetical protein